MHAVAGGELVGATQAAFRVERVAYGRVNHAVADRQRAERAI